MYGEKFEKKNRVGEMRYAVEVLNAISWLQSADHYSLSSRGKSMDAI
jgi:hypothetical protein